MHELYLWPFQDALRAGAGNIMSVRANKNFNDIVANTCPGAPTTE